MQAPLLTAEDFITQGNEAMHRKDWPEAIRIWALMRKQFPEHPRGYSSGAKALKKSKKFKAADALILKGMEKFPNEPKLYKQYGDIAVRRKDWPEAIKRWALMREQIPEHPHGYIGGVTALKESKEFEAADALALEGMKKFPKKPKLYAEYGNIAARRKDWPEAIKRWILMRKKFPENPHGYFSGAEALKESKEFEAADALALEGLEKFPDEPELYKQYGDIPARRKNWPEAIRRWTLMREKFPENPCGYVGGTTALKESKEFETADALAIEGMKRFPKETGLYIEYGDIAVRRKNWPEAAKRWALMREKFPGHPRGYISGTTALKEQKDFEAADAFVLEAMEKFPKEADLYAEYGDIAMRRKNWPEAAKRWTLMREKFPGHPRGYVSGAAALKEQKDFETADAFVRKAMKKFPQNAWLYIEYGDIAVRRKDWPEAAKRWALMREKFPGHPRGYIGEEAALKKIWDFEADEVFTLEALENFPETDIPKVSVVVPVCNPGAGFDRCLESLQTQTLANIEMVFVNDLGTNNAMDKVRSAAAKDPRIRIITTPGNLGAGPSRNKGMETARGEYLSFVDTDDCMSPDFLELLYNKAHKENLDIAKGTACCKRDDGIRRKVKSRLNDVILSGLAGHRSLYCLFVSEHWTGLYRRTLLMESGARYGASRNAEDSAFLLRVCHAAQTFGIENRAICYSVRRDSLMSNTFNAQWLKDQLDVLREQTDYLVGRVTPGNDAIFYSLKMFAHHLAVHTHETGPGLPELETAAAGYLSGIREQALRLPYLEDLKAQSFIFRALVDFGVGLSISPLFPSRGKTSSQAWIALVKRWCNFALAHPELADKYDKDLQEVLKRAADAVALEMKCGPRIDVKIYGTKESALELLDLSEKDARVTSPVWLYNLRQPGTGYVIEPYPRQTAITLDFVCKTAGEFTATLLGADVRDSNGKQIPKWVAYTSLTCNGEIVFKGEKQVYYDQPYRYKKTVQAGDAVKMEICWKNGDDDA